MKKRINSKSKGSAFERHCCDLLQSWWGGTFKRVPCSGGWDKDIVTGDIFCLDKTGKELDPTFPFSIECKNREVLALNHLFTSTGGEIVQNWWKQCTDDCPKDKWPLMFLSKNNFPVFVMTRLEVFYTSGPMFTCQSPNSIAHLRMCDLILMRWVDFSWIFTPPMLRKDELSPIHYYNYPFHGAAPRDWSSSSPQS